MGDPSERPAPPDGTGPGVVCDPAIQGGVPVFAGTRIPVEVVTAMRDAGWTEEQIRAEFPHLP